MLNKIIFNCFILSVFYCENRDIHFHFFDFVLIKPLVVSCALKLFSSRKVIAEKLSFNKLCKSRLIYIGENRLWLYSTYQIEISLVLAIFNLMIFKYLARLTNKAKTFKWFSLVEELHLSIILTPFRCVAMRMFTFCELICFLLLKNWWLTWKES